MHIEFWHKKEIRESKKWMPLIMFFGGGILVCFGIIANLIVSIALGLLIVLYGILTFFTESRRETKPAIVITNKGIEDNIHDVCFGFIEWSDITNIRINDDFDSLIFIEVRNGDKYLKKLKVNKRFGNYYLNQLRNDSFGYGTPVFLNVKKLHHSRNEIFEEIKKIYDSIR